MKLIPLSGKKGKGYYTLVSDEDYPTLSKFKWHKNGPCGHINRAIIVDSKMIHVRMQNAILWKPDGFVIDHINRCPWDNRRENLRICTPEENACNRVAYRCNPTGLKGVDWMPKLKKWRARIRKDGTEHHLGLFASKFAAAEAYNKAALRLHGEFANLNKTN